MRERWNTGNEIIKKKETGITSRRAPSVAHGGCRWAKRILEENKR